jgi:NADH:ubiquinone oxidoreductase subunit E
MVENETYDPKLRWRWIRADIAERGKARVRINAEDRMKIYRIIDRYKSVPGAVVPILREMNDTFSYLPEPALRAASEHLNIPLSELLRIATFYNEFDLAPRGRYVVTVCLGTTCYVKGAVGIVAAFEKELGIKTGETTGDMLFTLRTVRCLGCCSFAPVVKINGDVHNCMTKEKVPELIERYKGASIDA